MKAYLNSMIGNWYGRLEDIIEELEDEGYDVLEQSREYLVVGYGSHGEEVQVRIDLGGTERTITVDTVKEIYRG